MSEFTEKQSSLDQTLTPLHKQLAWELFLKRWEKIEPREYQVWKADYIDNCSDPNLASMIAEAYFFNLQEQKRFPKDEALFQLTDSILSEKDLEKRKAKIQEFLAQPDTNPRKSSRRAGRFRPDATSAEYQAQQHQSSK